MTGATVVGVGNASGSQTPAQSRRHKHDIERLHEELDRFIEDRVSEMKEASVIQHAATLRGWGDLDFAWPRDGARGTIESAGIPVAEQFRHQGLKMLPEPATFTDGSVSVEAGCMEMLTRMESGRLKVFDHLNDWFSEFRLYHRLEGKIVPEYDDLLSATRYAIVMLRFAKTKSFKDKWRRPIEYKDVYV